MNSSTMLESVAGWIAQSRKTRPAAAVRQRGRNGESGLRRDAGGQLI